MRYRIEYADGGTKVEEQLELVKHANDEAMR